MSMRFTFAALILIWFVRPMWDRAGRLMLVAFVGGTLAYGLQFTGLAGMDASTAVLVVQLEVVFVALFASVFFKDRLSGPQWGRDGPGACGRRADRGRAPRPERRPAPSPWWWPAGSCGPRASS